jgi:hypothetical protein
MVGRCQFHQHFYKCHFDSFFYVHATREKLPKQRSYKKFVPIMLMKLTAGRTLAYPPYQIRTGLYDYDHSDSELNAIMNKIKRFMY